MTKENINEILVHIGWPGKYQLSVFFWAFLIGAIDAMHSLVMVFTQGNMDFICVEGDYADAFNTTHSHGHRRDMSNYTAVAGSCSLYNGTEESCTKFAYSSDYFDNTVISEFDLICSREYYITISNVLFMAVRIPGGFISGLSMDKIGRKKILILGLASLGVCGIIVAYSVNIEMYIAMRCLQTIPILACYDSCALMLGEITAPKRRAHMVLGLVFAWGTGIAALSGVGYWLQNWRHLMLAISIPPLALCIIAFWVFDESPHWLYSQSRYDETEKVLEKIAKWNSCQDKLMRVNRLDKNQQLNEDGDDDEIDSDNPGREPFLKVLKAKRLRYLALITAFGWLAISMGYTGLSIGVTDLVGDIYINNFLSGVVELISYVIAFLVLAGGRKKVQIPLLIIGGAGLIANAVCSVFLKDFKWLIILTTMVGRLSVAATWQILYMWSMELFPTTVRMTLLQISLIAGHIGSSAAPFINDAHTLIKDANVKGEIIAPSIYGILLILAGVLSFKLPETQGIPLPVYIDDVENLHRNKKLEKYENKNNVELKSDLNQPN